MERPSTKVRSPSAAGTALPVRLAPMPSPPSRLCVLERADLLRRSPTLVARCWPVEQVRTGSNHAPRWLSLRRRPTGLQPTQHRQPSPRQGYFDSFLSPPRPAYKRSEFNGRLVAHGVARTHRATELSQRCRWLQKRHNGFENRYAIQSRSNSSIRLAASRRSSGTTCV